MESESALYPGQASLYAESISSALAPSFVTAISVEPEPLMKNAADKTNAVLILLLVLIPIFIDGETLFTLNCICTLGALYIGIRNLFELIGIYYHDRRI